MTDIFLYQGESTANNVKLTDPTALAGSGSVLSGQISVSGTAAQVVVGSRVATAVVSSSGVGTAVLTSHYVGRGQLSVSAAASATVTDHFVGRGTASAAAAATAGVASEVVLRGQLSVAGSATQQTVATRYIPDAVAVAAAATALVSGTVVPAYVPVVHSGRIATLISMSGNASGSIQNAQSYHEVQGYIRQHHVPSTMGGTRNWGKQANASEKEEAIKIAIELSGLNVRATPSHFQSIESVFKRTPENAELHEWVFGTAKAELDSSAIVKPSLVERDLALQLVTDTLEIVEFR